MCKGGFAHYHTTLAFLMLWQPTAAAASEQPEQEEITITSHRVQETTVRSPAVTVLHSADIDSIGKSNLADVLRLVGGTDIVRTGGVGSQASIFIRGSESNHSLVLLDGVPLNDPRTGAVDIGHLDLSAIDRVEIIRGPQATLQGAPGGIIHLLSKKETTPYASIRLDHHLGYHVAVGAATESRPLQLYAHAVSHYADAISAAAGGRESDASKTRQLHLGSVLRLEDISLRANLQWMDFVGDLDDYTTMPVDDPDYKRRRRQWQGSVVMQFGTEQVQQQWRISHHDIDEYFSNGRAAADSFLDGTRRDFSSSETIVAWTGVRRQQWPQLQSATLHGGAEWRRVQGSDAAFSDSVVEQAMWLQQDLDAGVVRLGAGGRLQRHPRYGLHGDFHLYVTVPIHNSWEFTTSYGKGYRVPSISEFAHPQFGNRSLEPERTRSITVGLQHQGQDHRWWLEHFLTYLQQRIDYDFTSMRLVNSGRASIAGIEFGGTRNWPQHGLALNFNVTRTDAVDSSSGNRLLRRPPYKWHLRLHKTMGDFALSATTRFVGSRPDVGGSLPSYFVVDANFSWHISRQLRWSLRLDNILGKNYQEALGYSAPGRELFLSLHWRPWASGQAQTVAQ